MAFPRRLTLLLLGFGACLTVVWVRVFSLQVVSRDRWTRAAHAMRHPGVRVDAPRGRILDAHGRVLVQDEAALGLTFVAGDWERRLRFRCRDCGAVQTRKPQDRVARRACSCRAPADRLEPMPDEDLAPLEDAIGIERGSLARFATERTRFLERRVETIARRTIDRLDLDEFRADDVKRALRDDHFRRENPLREREFGTGWKPEVADLPTPALRLLELDDEGRYRGFSARASLARRATHRGLLGQCLGTTKPPDPADLARLRGLISPTTPVGRTGVEGHYDDWLRGVPGIRYEDDESDEDVPEGTAPEPGADVRLALDLDACVEAQRILDEVAVAEGYAARGPPSGGFVAIDPRTGRIPAWSEAPRYDPDAGLAAPMTEEEAGRIRNRLPGDEPVEIETFDLKATPSVALSRVAQVAVEPGSAMKIVTALFALGSDHPPPGGFHCAGPASSRNEKPGCHHAHGAVDYEEAMCVSCNRWFAWALARDGVIGPFKHVYPAFARSIGIGGRTGIDLAHEGTGVLRIEDEWSYRHVAIGQGPITATPLQMARVAALVADGGRLVTPRLATAVGAREVPPESREVAVSPAAIAAVRRGMAACVGREGGTAFRAFTEIPPPPGVTVYGKTGTAQVPHGGAFDPDKIEDGPWHHWFVGFAERGDDRIAFAMVLYARTEAAGGLTAAKGCARFVQWWFTREPAR